MECEQNEELHPFYSFPSGFDEWHIPATQTPSSVSSSVQEKRKIQWSTLQWFYLMLGHRGREIEELLMEFTVCYASQMQQQLERGTRVEEVKVDFD